MLLVCDEIDIFRFVVEVLQSKGNPQSRATWWTIVCVQADWLVLWGWRVVFLHLFLAPYADICRCYLLWWLFLRSQWHLGHKGNVYILVLTASHDLEEILGLAKSCESHVTEYACFAKYLINASPPGLCSLFHLMSDSIHLSSGPASSLHLIVSPILKPLPYLQIIHVRIGTPHCLSHLRWSDSHSDVQWSRTCTCVENTSDSILIKWFHRSKKSSEWMYAADCPMCLISCHFIRTSVYQSWMNWPSPYPIFVCMFALWDKLRMMSVSMKHICEPPEVFRSFLFWPCKYYVCALHNQSLIFEL